MVFDNVLDMVSRERGEIKRSWDLEWFYGNTLKSYWDINIALPGSIGVPVFSMVDDINEGFSIFVPAVNPTLASITTGNITRQFDPVDCVMESVQKSVFVNGRYAVGLGNRTDGDLGNTIDESVFVSNNSTQTFYQLVNINGLLQSTVNTSVPVDQIFHRTNLNLSTTNSRLTIDGILEATNTTFLPDPLSKLYAGFKIATFAVLAAEIRIRYLEVFNT